MDCNCFKIEQFSPFRQRAADSVEGDSDSISSIPCLFGFWYPMAVFWFIVPVCVFTFNCKVWWTLFHVFQKKLKRIPAWDNFYTSSAIVFVILVVRGSATISHRSPCDISPRFLTSFSMAVFQRVFTDCLQMETAAGFSVTVTQTGDTHDCFFTTITLAQPPRAVTNWRGWSKSNQTPKSLASQISFSRAAAGFDFATFDVNSICFILVATITLAQPSSYSLSGTWDSFDASQSVELLSSEIRRDHESFSFMLLTL